MSLLIRDNEHYLEVRKEMMKMHYATPDTEPPPDPDAPPPAPEPEPDGDDDGDDE